MRIERGVRSATGGRFRLAAEAEVGTSTAQHQRLVARSRRGDCLAQIQHHLRCHHVAAVWTVDGDAEKGVGVFDDQVRSHGGLPCHVELRARGGSNARSGSIEREAPPGSEQASGTFFPPSSHRISGASGVDLLEQPFGRNRHPIDIEAEGFQRVLHSGGDGGRRGNGATLPGPFHAERIQRRTVTPGAPGRRSALPWPSAAGTRPGSRSAAERSRRSASIRRARCPPRGPCPPGSALRR